MSLLINPKVRAYLGGPVSQQSAAQQLEAHQKGAQNIGIWMVRKSSPLQTIGVIVFCPHIDGIEFEIAYQFAPECWAFGFATEANARVLSHVLNDLNCYKVIAETQTANLASCAMLERIGMKRIKTLERFDAEQAIYATVIAEKPISGPR